MRDDDNGIESSNCLWNTTWKTQEEFVEFLEMEMKKWNNEKQFY